MLVLIYLSTQGGSIGCVTSSRLQTASQASDGVHVNFPGTTCKAERDTPCSACTCVTFRALVGYLNLCKRRPYFSQRMVPAENCWPCQQPYVSVSVATGVSQTGFASLQMF